MDSTDPPRSNATPRGTLPLKLTEVWALDFELSLCNP